MGPIPSGQPDPTSFRNLPTPISVDYEGDPGAQMAALAIQNGETERVNAHQERQAEEAAEAKAEADAVQAMHDEASSMRAQGFFDAATSVAGAAIAIACPMPVASSATSGQAASATRGLVAGHLMDGVAKLSDGLFRAAQHDDEANATADKATATQHDDAAKDAAARAADASATISAALDFDRNYSSLDAQVQLAALHRA